MNQSTNITATVVADQEDPASGNVALEQTAKPSAGRTFVAYALLCAFVFATAWLGALGWMNRSLISDLFYESSLARYRVASGEAGPATFYVFHSDFSALEQLAHNNEDILGVELSEYSGIAAMAFTSLDAESVNTVRNLPIVKNMLQKDIPMLCH